MQIKTLIILPAILLAGCAADTVDLTPTAEESEYMAFVASQDDDMSARSCVSFVVADIDAHGVIGEWSQTAAVLQNHCSGLDIPVRAVEFIDTDGAFSLASEIPAIIPAGESVEILVDFKAKADIIHLAELRILVEDPNGPVQIAEFYGLVPRDSDRSGDPPDARVGGGVFSVVTGVSTDMDASNSSDPEGDVLTYRWSFKTVPGSSGVTDSSITNRFGEVASFTPDVDGSYRARLVVSDGTGSDKTFATYSASGSVNTAPVADAGPEVGVETGTLATLDGSGSSDAEGDPLTYTWTMHSPAAGSSLTTASLSGAATDTTSFTTDVTGFYVMKLRVNDGLLSGKDFATVFATENTPPVANAGANQTGAVSTLVDLNGSGSSDADGDTLNYNWSFKTVPGGSALVNSDITDRTTAIASFTPDVTGSYRIRLTVDDGSASDVDFMDVTVE